MAPPFNPNFLRFFEGGGHYYGFFFGHFFFFILTVTIVAGDLGDKLLVAYRPKTISNVAYNRQIRPYSTM